MCKELTYIFIMRGKDPTFASYKQPPTGNF
nr:MAG TPA: hypothetical protein [Caudoviricetes sp.]